MDKLFRLRMDQLRNAALVNIEKRLGFAIKFGLLLIALLAMSITWPDMIRRPLFYIFLLIFAAGTLVYAYLYRRFVPGHYNVIMAFSSCLEIFCISLVYCILAGDRLIPAIFLLLTLPILRIILLYPSVKEFIIALVSSCLVFLLVVAGLGTRQMLLPLFWIYFASLWLIFGFGIAIVDRLFKQFNQSAKSHQLILQALQMVSSLVEMAESTAHLHEKKAIFQRSVEIVSRIMAVRSCVAWIYQNDTLHPVAAAGLNEDEAKSFNLMELSAHDIPLFERALEQKMPIVVADAALEKAVPLHYRRSFQIKSMLVIPLSDNERVLGCVALHWLKAPEKITSQELAILSGIATQIGITLENVYLLEELREKEEVRGRLLERVISIQEGERERIARELHDETGQILTALMMNVELLRTEPDFQSHKSREQLDEISSLLSKTMRDIHNLSLELHPKILNELGLVPAIRWYMKNHLERWGIEFGIVASNLDHSLSAKQEIGLFRVAQEAITNVIRHAEAKRVEVEINIDAESVYLGIKDDGKGFQVDPWCGEGCLGLRSMQERVSFLGGQIDIRSEKGRGTEISVNIPLQAGSDS